MTTAHVTFNDLGLTVVVPRGVVMIEVSEQYGSNIIYGCREGDCGTCLMRVIEGAENLSAPSESEAKVLRDNLAGRDYRLACEARVLGDVTVEPA